MLADLLEYGDIGLLVLRVAIAAIFLVHGPKKLSGSMGSFMAFIGAVETAGAVGVLLGLFTQIAALALGVVMVGAIYKKTAEWRVPFTAMDKTGWEFDLMILAGCLALVFMGGGAFALDTGMWTGSTF